MQRRIRNGRAPDSFSWQVKHFCGVAWVPASNLFCIKHGWGEQGSALCPEPVGKGCGGWFTDSEDATPWVWLGNCFIGGFPGMSQQGQHHFHTWTVHVVGSFSAVGRDGGCWPCMLWSQKSEQHWVMHLIHEAGKVPCQFSWRHWKNTTGDWDCLKCLKKFEMVKRQRL